MSDRYIKLHDYFKIEKFLNEDLKLTKFNCYACKNQSNFTLYYNYIVVSDEYLKQVRQRLSKHDMFAILQTNKRITINAKKSLKYDFVHKLF